MSSLQDVLNRKKLEKAGGESSTGSQKVPVGKAKPKGKQVSVASNTSSKAKSLAEYMEHRKSPAPSQVSRTSTGGDTLKGMLAARRAGLNPHKSVSDVGSIKSLGSGTSMASVLDEIKGNKRQIEDLTRTVEELTLAIGQLVKK